MERVSFEGQETLLVLKQGLSLLLGAHFSIPDNDEFLE